VVRPFVIFVSFRGPTSGERKNTGLLSQSELTKLGVQLGLIQASDDGSLRGGSDYFQAGGDGELALALVEGDEAFQPQLQCAGHMQHIE
jgi:hypothetical protein